MTDRKFNLWVESLKVGDKVIIHGNYGDTIGTVERITATQIIAANERRYRKRDGYLIGRYSWNYERIGAATDESIARVKLEESRNRARYGVERYKGSLSQSDCDAIMQILAPHKNAEDTK